MESPSIDHAALPSGRINMENRPYVNLITSPTWCKRQMANPEPRCEGWCNEATWTFSMYFLQERGPYEGLVKIIKEGARNKDGTLRDSVYHKAKRYMENAYNSGKTEPMDDNVSGSVNVREIVDQLDAELK